MRRWFLVVIVLLIGSGITNAQGGVNLCDDDNLSAVADLLEQAAIAIRADSEDAVTLLSVTQLLIGYTIADCTGLKFDSETLGIAPAIGPFVVPAGIYRVKIEGDEGAVSVQQTVLGGECGQDGQIVGKLSSMPSAEAVYTVEEDCEIMLTMGFASKPWVLMFEKVR